MKPIRKCVACRVQKEKTEFLRVVKNKANEILVDKNAKLDGRGAYICKDVKCLEKAIKTRAFARAFKMQFPEEVFTKIENSIIELD